jgi:His/Glu/Gln/Arg/opine family amino acid ABC transporter permease subunit
MIDWISALIYRNFIHHDRYLLWLRGLRASLSIAFFALLLGMAIGLVIAIVRVSHDSMAEPHILLRIPNRIIKLYISVVRGIPMVVQLLIWSFVILAASRNQLLIGSLAFGINSGAYVAEVFRGGIVSVDKGQSEAGRSLGLSYPRTMTKIVLPQAIKNSLPAMGNEFINLFKLTSMAGMAAITEITHVGNVLRGLTFDQSPLIFVSAFYLIIVLILEFLVGRLEKHLRKSDRPVIARQKRSLWDGFSR